MNTYIYKLIKEQFNIGNMELTGNKPKNNMNIFNKASFDLQKVYNNIIKKNWADKDEIKSLNNITAAIKPKNRRELKKIIQFYSDMYPNDSLNWVDITEIKNMTSIFGGRSNYYPVEYNDYNGDISKWDMSNVTNMSGMFNNSNFNSDISMWDVSNVTDMSQMFWNSSFNMDISKWDVSNVKNMRSMFDNAKFNNDISQWDVSNVTDMSHMFQYSQFKGDISRWNISNVMNMSRMFQFSNFNSDISCWNISENTKCSYIFFKCNIPIEYMPKKLQNNYEQVYTETD